MTRLVNSGLGGKLLFTHLEEFTSLVSLGFFEKHIIVKNIVSVVEFCRIIEEIGGKIENKKDFARESQLYMGN